MTASCPLVCLHLAHPALSPICLHNPIYLHIIIMRIEPLFHLLVVGFASPSDLICSCVFSDSTIRHFFPHSFEVSTGFPFSHFLEHVTLQGLFLVFRVHSDTISKDTLWLFFLVLPVNILLYVFFVNPRL